MARKKDKRVSFKGDEEKEIGSHGQNEDSLPPSPGETVDASQFSQEQNISKKPAKKSKPKKEFDVEQIIGMEINFRWRSPIRFLVRWAEETETEDTWIPLHNLKCDKLIEEFLAISGRRPEYEKAMKRIHEEVNVNTDYRENLRTRHRIASYREDSDEEIYSCQGTRTRKSCRPEVYDPSNVGPQHLKSVPRRRDEQRQFHGISQAVAATVQAGRQYEVALIVDHRVRGRFTEYKVRWKGLSSANDSWVPEANLSCPKILADYLKSVRVAPEKDFEVAAIIDSREVDGRISYKVRWKGFSAKFDSWLPKEDLNCPQLVRKFETTLKKLNQKKNWVVSKIKSQREVNNQIEFLVGWEGFPSKFDTWEPEANLENCHEKLDEFYSRLEKKNNSADGYEGDEDYDSSDADDKNDEDFRCSVRKRKTAAEKKQMPKNADHESSKKKAKKESKLVKQNASSSSSTNRTRRSTAPVSYQEQDDLSD